MNRMPQARVLLLSCILVSCLNPGTLVAEGASDAPTAEATAVPRDGQHDFDFNIGTWKVRIRRLLHPLSGSNDWVELDGNVTVRNFWGGRALWEETEADGSTGHFEGVTLFLYNPEAHQWGQYFANSKVGILNPPLIGEFKNGRGEFVDQETFNDRSIFVRIVWSDITPDSHRLEQSFSDDGGRTWESNFIATMTRENEIQKKSENVSLQSSELPDVSHDFDFNFGIWKTHITRLRHPLAGSQTWVDYDGTSDVRKIWNGKASLFELEATGPAGHIEGVGLRLYNPKSRQWSLNWASSRDGVIGKPMIGEFANGEGHFYDQEDFQGRSIFDRNGFSDIKPDSSRFEQAFSDDGGKNWETNWIMTFTR